MFGLGFDELAALAGVAFLTLRVLWAVARILWWYVADSRRVSKLHPLTPLLTGVAAALMMIGLQSIIGGGLPRGVRLFAYVVAGLLGFVLGLMLDFVIDVRFYRMSDWLMGLHVPRFRQQLLSGDTASRIHAARQIASLGARAIPARPELIAAFKDESAEVRAAAAQAALYSIPDPPDDDPELAKAARPLLTDP